MGRNTDDAQTLGLHTLAAHEAGHDVIDRAEADAIAAVLARC
jgi:hypothetical protein